MDERDPPRRRQAPSMNFSFSNTEVNALSRPPDGTGLEKDLQQHIGRHLRAIYDDVVNETVPDRFRQLLEELERKEANRS